MEPTTIIKKPLITEKATYDSGERNRYTFEVDRRASKEDIKRAIEVLYKVRVMKIATQTRKGKLRRYKYGYVAQAPWKRAVVRVHPEDRIELF